MNSEHARNGIGTDATPYRLYTNFCSFHSKKLHNLLGLLSTKAVTSRMIRCCSFASYSSYHCSSRTLPCRLKRKTNLNCNEATLSKPQQQPAHVMMPRTIVKPLCDGNLPPILNRSEHRGSEYQFQSKLHTALIPALSLIPSTLSSGTGKQRFTGLSLASSKARNPSRFNCVLLIREGGG